MMNRFEVEQLTLIARQAGAAILDIYGGEFRVETKSDASLLTCADRAAHDIIWAGLSKAWPEIPILSEEGKGIPFDERREWRRFWLVDPLDGTKEFIKRNGEFTVNIALIEGGFPVFGVVYLPVLGRLYRGGRRAGAWLLNGDEKPIRVRRADPSRGLSVVQSRSHPSAELDAYLRMLPVSESVEVGSSLKFCTVAEGRADLYPRFGPTMEWDTAAGQAIVEGAGGSVDDLQGRRLGYNKASLLNPWFLVKGDTAGCADSVPTFHTRQQEP